MNDKEFIEYVQSQFLSLHHEIARTQVTVESLERKLEARIAELADKLDGKS